MRAEIARSAQFFRSLLETSVSATNALDFLRDWRLRKESRVSAQKSMILTQKGCRGFESHPLRQPVSIFLRRSHIKRKSLFSARIVDIFRLECAYRRNLAFELSRKLPFFSPVNTEVHFHKKHPWPPEGSPGHVPFYLVEPWANAAATAPSRGGR